MIVGSAPPMSCGIGDNTVALAKHLAQRGHTVDIITSSKASSVSSISGVAIHPVMTSWSALYASTLLKTVIELEPDIIHMQYPSKGYGRGFAPSILGMRLRARRSRAPYIVTLHEFAFAHPLRKAAIVPLLSEATAMIIPSVQERDALIKRFGTLKKIPSHIIPIGAVLPDDFEKLKEELKNKREELIKKWEAPPDGVIVSYGFIQYHKGIEIILKAVKTLRQEGYSCAFWHVGDFNPKKSRYHRYLKYLSDEKPLKDGVRFLGFMPLEKASEIFTVARVGVFPFTDGYSDRRSSMITLAHFDVPLITTRSSIPEVDDKISPYVKLIDRHNTKQLTDSLREIIANDAIYEHEKERVGGFKNLYDWRIIAERTEALYREYLK